MLLPASGLIISLAFFLGIAPLPARASSTTRSPAAPCVVGFRQIASKPPALSALRKDLPEIEDPLRYIASFENRRRDWNLENSTNRNNFPMPEMGRSVDSLLKSLRQVKRPAENRIAAERYIKELSSLKDRHFPYRDSLLKMHEALSVIALKHPLTPEKAKAIANAGTPHSKREKFDLDKFFTSDNQARRSEFEEMMEKEIFYPTAHEQTVDGLAESFLVGIRPLQISERSSVADQLEMTALHRFEHDVAHIVIQKTDRLSKVIAALPFDVRVDIARDISALPTEREKHLARFGIFQTLHEWGNDSMIPYRFQHDAAKAVQTEYRTVTGNEITVDEAQWLQDWYRNTVGRRLFDAQSK